LAQQLIAMHEFSLLAVEQINPKLWILWKT